MNPNPCAIISLPAASPRNGPPDVMSWHREGYTISTDRALLQLDVIHDYLAGHSYWASGIPRETVARSIENSICFGLFAGDEQVGFARVVTDRATFAYLGDVFVLEAHRGKGLAKWLMQCILEHPQLRGLRRWMLATRDAHSLYAQFGFQALAAPQTLMEKHDGDLYRRSGAASPRCKKS